ncbi:hypothetical protein [Pedobacter caeni]|uniref:Uncharacterized protein n=1 Tax=Pedobacter caeni TaxID=288992 RepID=A0A1M5BAS5_9SPHI|nr:hypothetical protein [Pedobacter caeni]SHF39525.1 hypothetical protein SAMN04488522_1021107 [Pedobacter caeni]
MTHLRTLSILLATTLLNLSCLENRNSNNGNKVDLNIKTILSDQIEAGNDQTYGSFDEYGEKDLNALVLVEDTILNNHGYKKIDRKLFNQRIEVIFGRTIDGNSKKSYIKIDTYIDNICNKELLFAPYSGDAQYIYVAKKEQFLTNFHPLPKILDYLKLYPELAEFEKKDIEIYDAIEEETTRASQWKDHIKELPGERQRNIKTLVHRNKYLFNDDKASLDWLLRNDDSFLALLLIGYGYDQEPRINKMVLDSIYNLNTQTSPTSEEKIADLFFVKDCNGKLKIRKGLLKYVEDNTSSTDNRFIYALSSYPYFLYSEDLDKVFDEEPSKKFNAVEKAKIVAYIANIENPAIDKYKTFESSEVWTNAASTLYNLSVSHPEIIKLIEQNNYFGLPKMKGIIGKLKLEGQGEPE